MFVCLLVSTPVVFEALPHQRTNIPARSNCSQGAVGDFTLNPEATLAVPNQSTEALNPASYTSVSPTLATQTPPEEHFRRYLNGKYVPSLPGGNPDASVRPEGGHRAPHTAKVPGVGFFPQILSGNESQNKPESDTHGKPGHNSRARVRRSFPSPSATT